MAALVAVHSFPGASCRTTDGEDDDDGNDDEDGEDDDNVDDDEDSKDDEDGEVDDNGAADSMNCKSWSAEERLRWR